MAVFPWTYGTTLSGLSFPMVTASGTYAKGYLPATMSSVLSKDGGAWAGLGGRISGIPGDGIYSITSLSSVEMQCYTWAIKITANSGSLDQMILGVNRSGPVMYSDISGFALKNDISALAGILVAISGLKNDVSGLPAILTNISSIGLNISGRAHDTDVSALAGILVAVSGLKNDVSGIPGIASSISGLNTSNLIAQCSSILNAVSNVTATVNYSGVASQVWNSLPATYSSGTTFGGITTNQSNILNAVSSVTATVDYSSVARQVWNTARAIATSATTFGGYVNISGGFVNVSGLDSILNACSGNDKILTAVSGLKNDVSGLPGILTACSGNDKILSAVSGLKNDVSGLPGTFLNTSGLAHLLDTSGLDNIYTTINNRTSGIPGIAASISGLNTSNLIAQASSIYGQFAPLATLNSVSGMPGIYLNTSGIAHSLDTSGMDNIYTTLNTRTSGIPGIASSISGLNTSNLIAQCSSILQGVSGVPSGVSVIPTTGATSLTSGTLAHDLRLLRRQSWGDMNIDKTYTPIRMYLQDDAGNMSSYFTLTDDANNTIRTKI